MDARDHLRFGVRRSLPLILQTESTECGLACLAMIAQYHGLGADLPSLRRRFPVSLKGATLASLIDVARELKLASRPVTLELRDLARLRLPCLLHWNFTHFVVLKAVGARAACIHDPASGVRKMPFDEVSRAFTGVALELWPAPDFRPAPRAAPIRLRDLIGPVTGLYAALGQILLLALVLEVFAVANPLFLQWVIDRVLVASDRNLLSVLAFGFGLLVLLNQAVTGLRAWVILYLGTTLNVEWRSRVFTHLLELPMPYFERRHLGDIVSRFSSVDLIQRALTASFVEAIIDGLMAVLTFVMILLYSGKLAAICAGATALYALGRATWYAPLRRATEEWIVHAAKQQSHFLETVRGVKAIKLFQRESIRRSSWLATLVDQVNADLRSQRLNLFYRLSNGLTFGLDNVLVVWLGAKLVLDGLLSAGMLMAFMAYKTQFATRAAALIDKFFELKMLRLQGERLADIVMSEPEPARIETRPLALSPAAAPIIALHGLRFRYAPHEPFVLDGVDLEIERGESVAIVGPSGSGKTTLLNVMLGLLPAAAGEVLFEGVSLAQSGPRAVRAAAGTVMQDDALFAGTIAENISFFDPDADQAWVEECARLASIHADIVRMPMAYHTFVGYFGSALSAGQRQRVLLARALYRRPKLLVLDEATSYLDVKRETIVSAAVRALDITRIIVAHRPQTVESADRVVTLEAGRIAHGRRVAPSLSSLRQCAPLDDAVVT
jgi:ATP-binding cassette subfamily B protein RaxB